MRTLTLQSPAKINLMLAVTGRRTDGFHELLSVVAPLAWGDTLTVQVEDASGATGPNAGTQIAAFALTCDDPAVPADRTNLVLKAAEAFRAATGWTGAARFALEKRIPIGAGLGGGSSNAAMALRALNQLAGEPLTHPQLTALAAGVGSDCALFLHDGPVVMRGRGERIEPLPAAAANRLRGRSVLVFKPAFGISTAWAYGRLAADAPRSYVAEAEAEARLARWIAADAESAELLFNNMETPAFAKFPALPVLLQRLQQRFGISGRMSGSGSACFALLPAGTDASAIGAAIRQAWGESAFVIPTHLQ